MSLSPFTSTLDSGARADSATETYDIPTRGRKGLLLATDVTAIGNGKSYVVGAAVTLPHVVTLDSNDHFTYDGDDYTIAAGSYATTALLATALGAATKSGPVALSTLVDVTAESSTTLRFTSHVTGVNAKVFAVGASHDGLADATGLTDGWTIAHTEAAGADGAYSATVTIQGKDEASGKFYDILAGTALSTVTTQVLQVHPQMADSANAVAASLLPANIRVSISHTTNNSITRTIGAQLVS